MDLRGHRLFEHSNFPCASSMTKERHKNSNIIKASSSSDISRDHVFLQCNISFHTLLKDR